MSRRHVCLAWCRFLTLARVAVKLGGAGTPNKAKEQEELDQVAGNAEDEIGERIAAMREHELLYGSHSLLATFGPMLVHICGSPHKFKVGALARHMTSR